MSRINALHELWVERFKSLEVELNALDAATGDGDHGATMMKGLNAVASSEFASSKAFRKAAGGASGSLFSILVGALDQIHQEPDSLKKSLSSAAYKISEIGDASAGDKTLLDALIPASHADNLADAVSAARKGFDETVSMRARRGRARYVEGAGVGHADAGARSVVELLAVLHECVSLTDNTDASNGKKGRDTDTAQESMP